MISTSIKTTSTLHGSFCNSVSAAFKDKFDELSESKEIDLATSGYESIPIDAHYPVLDIPYLPQKSINRTLSKAVIQGSFDYSRRGYADIFSNLIQSLLGTHCDYTSRPYS